MPDQDGLQTILNIRRDWPSLKVIAMSGSAPRAMLVIYVMPCCWIRIISMQNHSGQINCSKAVTAHGVGKKGLRGRPGYESTYV